MTATNLSATLNSAHLSPAARGVIATLASAAVTATPRPIVSLYARLSLVLADASTAIEDVLRDRENEIVSELATMAGARYVDYRRVLPIPGAIQQATPPAAVDPKLLGTICKAAELLDDRLKVTPHVRFFAADEHGPQCAAIASDAIAAVMPMRADSAEYADVYTAIF